MSRRMILPVALATTLLAAACTGSSDAGANETPAIERAAPTFEPLAVVDVGSTGGGNFPATDLAPVLLDSQLDGIPIPNEGSLIGNRVKYFPYAAMLEDGVELYQWDVEFTTQVTTDIPISDILDRYRAAIGTAGEFGYREDEQASGTMSQVGFVATPLDIDDDLQQYTVTVVSDSESPGVAQIGVRSEDQSAPGQLPLPVGLAAEDLAEPIRAAEENGFTLVNWNHSRGLQQFAVYEATERVYAEYEMTLGVGTADDLPATVALAQELFGTADQVTELNPSFFELEYGDLSELRVDAHLVDNGADLLLALTWTINRAVET